jgi:hypothetical protein
MGLPHKEQVKVFKTYWQVIEQNAQVEVKRESKVSAFIRDFLTLTTNKIPTKSKVYEAFKKLYQERDSNFYDQTLARLKAYSYHYNKLLNPEREPDPVLAHELRQIDLLEINTAFPFLLSVYEDYENGILSKEQFWQVLRLVQTFTWRRFILGLPTNALNKIFMTLYNDVVPEDYVPSIERSLLRKKGSGRFPNDAEIKAALKEKDLYNIRSKNRNYLFNQLENYNNREYVPTENPQITVEHIFPQTPDPSWKKSMDPDTYQAFREKYLHTLANLTLSGNNGKLGNKSFQEKKVMNVNEGEQGYQYSRLWLNGYLREIDEWGLLALNKRFDLLLKRFFKIWPYPNIEELFDDSNAQLYTLAEAPSPKNQKLEYFIFLDEKVITAEVAKMYYHVMKACFEAYQTAFLTSDLQEQVGISTNEDDLRTPYQISDHYFLESNIDNESKFRRLRIVLDRFDLLDELEFRYV